MKKQTHRVSIALGVVTLLSCAALSFGQSVETGMKLDLSGKKAGDTTDEVSDLSKGTAEAKATAEKMTKEAKVAQIFTSDITAKYKTELAELEKTRADVQKQIDAEKDPAKKQAAAMGFYRLQKSFLDRLADDLSHNNAYLDKIYSDLQMAAGGYSGAEGTLDKEAAAIAEREKTVRSQSDMKREAMQLLAEKKAMPGYDEKADDKEAKIDKTSPAWFAYKKKENELLRKYKAIDKELVRCERKAKFYGQVKGILSAHKDKAVKWLEYADGVKEGFYELSQDLAFEREKINEMIALGGLTDTLAAMASLRKSQGDVEGFVGTLANWGFLADIDILDPDKLDDGKTQPGRRPLTLEEIVK